MIKHYYLSLLLMLPLMVFSQDGEVDLTFNTPVHTSAPNINGFEDQFGVASVFSAKILANGKLLVYGKFDSYQGVTVNDVAVLNTDGTLDTTFSAGTGITENFNTGAQQTLDVQPDGKILIAGSFTTFNGLAANNLVRLNTDGSVDHSFIPALPFHAYITCIKLQNDGRILCAGSFAGEFEDPKGDIIRLTTDGSIDTSFTTGTGFTMSLPLAEPDPGFVYTIAIQDDNKILAGGYFARYNGVTKFNLVRLNADGTIDTNFFIGEGASVLEPYTEHFGTVNKIVAHPSSGKIYIAGTMAMFNGEPSKNVIRLHEDGTVDSAFNFTDDPGYSQGFPDRYISELAVNYEGKLLIGGSFFLNNCRDIAMYNQDGQTDIGFTAQVTGSLDNITTICTAGTAIYAAGHFSAVNGYNNNKGSVVKLHENGQTDLSFNPNLGANAVSGKCQTAFEMADGNIIISVQNPDAPWFETVNTALYNERPAPGALKINADGSIYTADYGNFLTSNVAAAFISSDNLGNLVLSDPVATSKLYANGVTSPLYTNTRSIIAPYDVNVNVFTNVHAVQPDNKIVIAGNFRYTDRLGGVYRQRIMRVNSDGTLDAGFYVGKGFNGTEISGSGYFNDYIIEVDALAIQADGKILAGGYFSDYNETAVSNIARLNIDGTLDDTFNQGSGFNKPVKNVKYLANGKLIICGYFTQYNSVPVNYIVRLNEDGTIDPAFTSPYTLNPEPLHTAHISNVTVQPDGKYLVSGNLYNVQFLNRLNADGTLDATFNNEIVFGGTVSDYSDLVTSLSTLHNGKILVTGTFTYIDGIRRTGIALLNNTAPIADTNDNVKGNTATQKVIIAPNPVNNTLIMKSAIVINRIELFTLDARLLQSGNVTQNKCDVSALPAGIYMVKMYSGKDVFNSKFIKNSF
jgi:uncharacterized delta-60 repeat protein